MPYYVYIITNSHNNKKYVGKTTREPKKRWNYGSSYHDNKDFYNDIKRWGWGSFDKEVIECNSELEMSTLEMNLIDELNTQNPDYGYNIAAGYTGGQEALKARQKEIFRQRALDAEKRWLEKQKQQ